MMHDRCGRDKVKRKGLRQRRRMGITLATGGLQHSADAKASDS
jgi:hypothetical protein